MWNSSAGTSNHTGGSKRKSISSGQIPFNSVEELPRQKQRSWSELHMEGRAEPLRAPGLSGISDIIVLKPVILH